MKREASRVVADSIKRRVLDAAQAADEIGGPDYPEYIGMMRDLAAEFSKRAEIADEERPRNKVRDYIRRLTGNPKADIWETGGGCTALAGYIRMSYHGKDKPDKELPYWMITDESSAPENVSTPLSVGFYSPEGDRWLCFEVSDALRAAKLINSLVTIEL